MHLVRKLPGRSDSLSKTLQQSLMVSLDLAWCEQCRRQRLKRKSISSRLAMTSLSNTEGRAMGGSSMASAIPRIRKRQHDDGRPPVVTLKSSNTMLERRRPLMNQPFLTAASSSAGVAVPCLVLYSLGLSKSFFLLAHMPFRFVLAHHSAFRYFCSRPSPNSAPVFAS